MKMPQTKTPSPLKITNLSVKYGNFYAVKGLNLELRKGEIFGLLGPNGAGKTSTISTLVTLETPSEGEIEVLGVNVTQNPIQAKSHIGYVPQEVINHGYFSVNEILNFHSGYFGRRKNQVRIDFLLHKLGLFEHRDKKVKQLSGGMKRRLLIAKALVHEPELVILDEPTAGVDIELRTSLWEFVKEIKDLGTTILLTTHYLEEAEALCDRIGVIHGGRILKVDSTQKLIEELTQRKVKIYFSQAPSQGIQSPYLITPQGAQNLVSPQSTSRLSVSGKSQEFFLEFVLPYSKDLGEVLKSLGQDLNKVTDLRIEEGKLEEAFLNILHHENSEGQKPSVTSVEVRL